ncbi:hypothetical protein LTR53_007915 [Teratosphaeriaceae sp. CCFEE 6253]|nr:hypothetical protein LTR53_007915 [Teratosphaeriaceae sp. CCFEE 6253]
MFVILTLVLLLLRSRSGLPYATAIDVFVTFDNNSGWTTPGAVVLSSLVPLSSAMGYDCTFHMGKFTAGALDIGLIKTVGENIKNASSVMPVALSVPDFDDAFNTELANSNPIGPVVQIIYNATESVACTTSLVALVLASMLPSCANAFTAASRQLWAFSDDKGLPKSDWIQKLTVSCLCSALVVPHDVDQRMLL